MNDFTKIIIGNSEPLDKKGQIFIYGIEDRVHGSLDFIKKKYRNKEDFYLAIEFMEYAHSDAVKADIDQLQRVGYFPATETEMELDHSIKHALIGSYKAAFADLRRALELTVISVYLTSERVKREIAIKWVVSERDTPGFSKSLKELIKQGRFKCINEKTNWKKELQHFYWLLSDYSHNKGQLKGYRELNKTNLFTGGTSAPSTNYKTLVAFCDFYSKTVKEIIVLLALYNPMILVGVPLDEKFGLDGPLSGFFYEGQAELVHQLIPEQYKDYFKNLVESDDEIKSVLQYFNSLSDLSVQDVEKQAMKQKESFNQMNSKNKNK
jgi:hypothetical protein